MGSGAPPPTAAILWRCGTALKEELFHLGLEEFARVRFDWCKAVLVDEHGLVGQPALPCFLGYVVVDTLSQFARVRRVIEAFSPFAQHDAFNRT